MEIAAETGSSGHADTMARCAHHRRDTGTRPHEKYRRIVPRLGHAQAIGAITHQVCRSIWKILHERVRYEERGASVNADAKAHCAATQLG